MTRASALRAISLPRGQPLEAGLVAKLEDHFPFNPLFDRTKVAARRPGLDFGLFSLFRVLPGARNS